MGIDTNLVPLLAEISKRAAFSGILCTLGVQDLPTGSERISFFSQFGFSDVESLDVSTYEGAKHIFDLNADDLPRHLESRFGAVLNGGTLEHVFHIPNALTSITRMLSTHGHVIHVVPCNGWVEHGFYQFSPTLLFDYYAAAKFDQFESALCSFDLGEPDNWLVRPIAPGDLGDGSRGAIESGVHLYVFVARKSPDAIERPTPLQSFYSRATRRARPHWFYPYRSKSGLTSKGSLEIRITPDVISRETGHCWLTPVTELAGISSDNMHPVRSPVILLEDGVPLGPPNSSHQTIREVGRGVFSHWISALYFSTSDNSDPTTNRRAYSIIVPK